jgi:hypothetical protein
MGIEIKIFLENNTSYEENMLFDYMNSALIIKNVTSYFMLVFGNVTVNYLHNKTICYIINTDFNGRVDAKHFSYYNNV